MNRSCNNTDLERFRAIVAAGLGLQFDEGKLDLLADLLARRLHALGRLSPSVYFGLFSQSAGAGELAHLATQLTVSETYFFRSTNHQRVLLETVLPERIRAGAAVRRLRLLSAGCASGEEAYSLAILLREHFPEVCSWDVRILGLDINPEIVAKARNGRYCAWSLRDTPPEIQAKYFTLRGMEYVLDDSIRSMVTFEERNLARGAWAPFGEGDRFDVIFFRNVLMYLVPDAAQEAISRITQALMPGGYLFLGYAETLRGISHDYHLRHTHDAFYYQRREGNGDPVQSVEPSPAAACSRRANEAAADDWVAKVREASERINQLSDRSGPDSPAPLRETRAASDLSRGRPAIKIGMVLELLRAEKFREALDLLQRLPAAAGEDADIRLLHAVLLTNCGDPQSAEALCRQVLLADDLNSDAHYLAALCRERAGDTRRAMEHDQAAIYLDDTFAMPHLHLGRLARRAADLITARRELGQAEMLLLRENASRILLFGGGFTREALVDFSRAEFRACGGVA